MLNLGIIGYGYWGPNVARNISNCKGTKLVSICDMNENRLKLAKSTYPSIKDYSELWSIIRSYSRGPSGRSGRSSILKN